jgi:diguanylate cyclase (GGDEF)-like protein
MYRMRQGARVGDEAVTRLAHALRTAARKGDLIARLADARFVLLLYGATGTEARRLAERLRADVQGMAFKVEGEEAGVSLPASVGASTYPDDGVRADALFDLAELALQRDRADRERAVER